MPQLLGVLLALFVVMLVCEILWLIAQWIWAFVILFWDALLLPFFFYFTPAVLIILALTAIYWGVWIASKNYFLSLKANIVSDGFAGALTRKYIISVLTLFLVSMCLSLAIHSALFIYPQGKKFVTYVDNHYQSIKFPAFTIHFLFGIFGKDKIEALPTIHQTTPINETSETLYVNTQQMKLRSGAGAEYGELGRVFMGDTLVATETALSTDGGNWVKVKTGNLEGWLNRQYLSTTQPVIEADPTASKQIPDSQTQKESAPENLEQHIQKMLEGAMNNDENIIQTNKQYLENLPRPPRGDRNTAREINDEALAFIKKQQYDQALPLFAKATQIDPSDVEILNNYGFVLMKSRDLDSALLVLTKTLTMKPDRTSAWANLADVLALQGRVDLATAGYMNVYRFSKSREKTYKSLQNPQLHEDSPYVREALTNAIQKITR